MNYRERDRLLISVFSGIVLHVGLFFALNAMNWSTADIPAQKIGPVYVELAPSDTQIRLQDLRAQENPAPELAAPTEQRPAEHAVVAQREQDRSAVQTNRTVQNRQTPGPSANQSASQRSSAPAENPNTGRQTPVAPKPVASSAPPPPPGPKPLSQEDVFTYEERPEVPVPSASRLQTASTAQQANTGLQGVDTRQVDEALKASQSGGVGTQQGADHQGAGSKTLISEPGKRMTIRGKGIGTRTLVSGNTDIPVSEGLKRQIQQTGRTEYSYTVQFSILPSGLVEPNSLKFIPEIEYSELKASIEKVVRTWRFTNISTESSETIQGEFEYRIQVR